MDFIIPLGKPGVMCRYSFKNVVKLCRYFGDEGFITSFRVGKLEPDAGHPWKDKKFVVNETNYVRVLLFHSLLDFGELSKYFSQYHIDLQPFERFKDDVYDVEMCKDRDVVRMETRGQRVKEEAPR